MECSERTKTATRYNIGDKFVVVDNSEGIHFFDLGDVVTYSGKEFGDYVGFTNGQINQGLPAADVVTYYDLEAMDFNYVYTLEGSLLPAFSWQETPEGAEYWLNMYNNDEGITVEGQEKLDAMIKLYEFYQSQKTLSQSDSNHGVVDISNETVLDIMQEFEDWVNDSDYLDEGLIADNATLFVVDDDPVEFEDWVAVQPYPDPFEIDRLPNGGPAKYYDLPPNAVTLNDLIEFKSYNQWLGDTAHLFNIFKAAWRWGIKEGTSKEYDARKFIYSGARLLMHYAGVEATRETLQKMLDDKQFQSRSDDSEAKVVKINGTSNGR